jgi:hypothetical protein
MNKLEEWILRECFRAITYMAMAGIVSAVIIKAFIWFYVGVGDDNH